MIFLDIVNFSRLAKENSPSGISVNLFLSSSICEEKPNMTRTEMTTVDFGCIAFQGCGRVFQGIIPGCLHPLPSTQVWEYQRLEP